MSDLEAYIASFDTEPGYLDWAAFGPLSARVRAEMHADAELLATGRRSGIDLVSGHVGVARELLAELLDAPTDQVVLQPSTSYGLMQALYGLRGRVLLSRAEFPSLTVTATRAASLRDDLRVQWMDPDGGFVTADAVRSALTDEVTAVAVSLVDFRTGFLADLSALREAIGDRMLIVDAIQGFGVVDADYAAADVVCGNGYKWLRAARGTGWARFSERARTRIEPVLSGFAGTTVDLPVDEVPAAASTAQAFTVTGSDILAAGRLATGLEEVRDAGVAGIADAVADRADEIIAAADEYGIAVVTPHDRARRAGIVALAPEPTEAAGLSAALANSGLTFTARSGLIRLAPHAGTDASTLQLLRDALGVFVTERSR
ncbi:aminotransferase class V-fold PLP-dependent enzyme [Microbacterium protaetiae]|uniref:Aminotransferase class V-fold PLP-dependent enzyme n=1 Tax=Microbacterium protaetiae TaxID=2509458 RepID=A0A4P6ESI6_9MICO|nr:aminotransferase class V-fold PLP-dependent enzyme [Microbacterium protaetiae]QAY60938.1 aminotransferase class V-fold PLP-dependent enzyme [Microbacterium protaetiae]